MHLLRVINVSCSQYSKADLDLETLFKERPLYNPVSEYARLVFILHKDTDYQISKYQQRENFTKYVL